MASSDCIYPTIPSAPPDGEAFRLQKISDVQSTLEKSISHYTGVRKKYARARAIVRGVAVATGILSAALSASGLATSLSGVGLPIGASLAAVAAIFGITSSAVTVAGRRLNKRVSTHEQTVALARAKLNTIRDLVSKALRDGKVSDSEFQLILEEADRFEALRLELRRKKTENPDSLRDRLRAEIREEVRSKMAAVV